MQARPVSGLLWKYNLVRGPPATTNTTTPHTAATETHSTGAALGNTHHGWVVGARRGLCVGRQAVRPIPGTSLPCRTNCERVRYSPLPPNIRWRVGHLGSHRLNSKKVHSTMNVFIVL